MATRWRRNRVAERNATRTLDVVIMVLEALEAIGDQMSEIQDALASEDSAIANLGTQLGSTLADLQNEIAALKANPQIPDGLLDGIQGHTERLEALAAQVATADPGAQPVTSTPAPVAGTPAPEGTTSDDSGVTGTPAPSDGSGEVNTPAPTDTTPVAPGTEVSPGVTVNEVVGGDNAPTGA